MRTQNTIRDERSIPIYDSSECVHPSSNQVCITDKRDINEIDRRMKKQSRQPLRDELYSVNPDFDGIYSHPENR